MTNVELFGDVQHLIYEVDVVLDRWFADGSNVHPADKNRLATVRQTLSEVQIGIFERLEEGARQVDRSED
jgi:hypothetical protein